MYCSLVLLFTADMHLLGIFMCINTHTRARAHTYAYTCARFNGGLLRIHPKRPRFHLVGNHDVDILNQSSVFANIHDSDATDMNVEVGGHVTTLSLL